MGIVAAYTEADLAAVRAAKLALVKGERVRSVTLPGIGTTYADATLEQMAELEREISQAISTSAGRTHIVVAGGKGL